ncbi:Nucleoside-diphosphate-sugar epimerase [Prevotellaceae bacterium HUN156]|nr:Nucleoside-diphosphate-sugar epimerase [Prevotellaceae bacterium HUN156]
MVEISAYQQDLAKAAKLLSSPLTGNILITGATGLIGGCITDMLMQHSECHVYALGRNRQRAEQRFHSYWDNPRFHFLEHDICTPLSCDTDFQYIIHAASNASPSFFQQKPVEVMRANLEGLSHLVDYGIQHHMQCMVYVSSGEIYGEGDGSIFTESSSGYIDILSPRACYPSSKRAAETLCAAYNQEYHTQITIARPCHTYGPYFTESDNRVYAQFIRNVLRNEDIVMKSLGSQFRSWIYVVDCATAILSILLKGESGEAYNVANDESNITIRELAEKTAAIAGKKVIMELSDNGNTTPITKAVFSTKKLEALGWQPLFDIDEGLRHTIETMR